MTERLGLFFSFWAYPFLSGVLLYSSILHEPERRMFEISILIVYGLVLWTFIEYLMHRFLFHPHYAVDSFQRLAETLHGIHHQKPKDPTEILTSASKSIPPSFLILGMLWLVTGSFLSSAGMITGVWVGFMYYEWTHYRVHTSNSSKLLDWHRRRHFHHHFVDNGAYFGVTSPLWDFVFCTLKK